MTAVTAVTEPVLAPRRPRVICHTIGARFGVRTLMLEGVERRAGDVRWLRYRVEVAKR